MCGPRHRGAAPTVTKGCAGALFDVVVRGGDLGEPTLDDGAELGRDVLVEGLLVLADRVVLTLLGCVDNGVEGRIFEERGGGGAGQESESMIGMLRRSSVVERCVYSEWGEWEVVE